MTQYRKKNTSILLTSQESQSLLEGIKSSIIYAKKVPSHVGTHNLAAPSPRNLERLKNLVPHRKGKPAYELSGDRKNSGR